MPGPNDMPMMIKNMHQNQLVSQKEYFENKSFDELLHINSDDFARETFVNLSTNESFRLENYLNDLKSVVESKINGDSYFVQEKEIDSYKLKTPREIKSRRPSRSIRKARKNLYKEQLARIQLLQDNHKKGVNLNEKDVYDIESELLKIEGYDLSEKYIEPVMLLNAKRQFYSAKKYMNSDKTAIIEYYEEYTKLKKVHIESSMEQLTYEYEQASQELSNIIQEYNRTRFYGQEIKYVPETISENDTRNSILIKLDNVKNKLRIYSKDRLEKQTRRYANREEIIHNITKGQEVNGIDIDIYANYMASDVNDFFDELIELTSNKTSKAAIEVKDIITKYKEEFRFDDIDLHIDDRFFYNTVFNAIEKIDSDMKLYKAMREMGASTGFVRLIDFVKREDRKRKYLV